jgi:hypothetical protein
MTINYSIGQYIRATVSDPEYFTLGQRGKIISIIEDDASIDGYAYYIEFVDGEVYWYLGCDEFVLEH